MSKRGNKFESWLRLPYCGLDLRGPSLFSPCVQKITVTLRINQLVRKMREIIEQWWKMYFDIDKFIVAAVFPCIFSFSIFPFCTEKKVLFVKLWNK